MAAVVGATTPRILFAPRRSIVLFGDSRVANAGSFDATNQKTTALDWFTYGQALVPGGPVYDMVANKGIGGNTTTQMAARFATDVLALTPDAVVIWGGTNDTWSTTSDVDVTVSRMTAMIDRARLAGIYVYVVGDTVCSTKGSGFNKLMMYYNDVLRQYGFATRGVEFWDFNSQIIDPASTSGNPLANVTIDGLHVSATGAYLCGKNVIAPSLAKLSGRGVSLTSSIVDNYANNGNSRNLFSKGYMQGAGGTAGTGNSGTLPTGWSGSRSGTGSGVFSVNARADGFGNDVRTVATFGAANDNVSLIAILDTNPTLAGTYVLEAALTVSGATNLNRCDLYGQITVNNGSNVSYNFGCLTQNQSTLLFPSAMGPLILRSPPMTLPAAGTVVSHNVQLVMTGNGAGGATVDLGRASVRRVG